MEQLMQYVWRYRLWPVADMVTVDGRRIEVLDPGLQNTDSGPDFFNAKIYIDGQLWVGNVEMHVRASDWHRHGHDRDHAYDSVVLHVVERDDTAICRPDGQVIPQMVMTCARDFAQKYDRMVNDRLHQLPCSNEIGTLSALHIADWLNALAHERLFGKSDRVLAHLKRYNGNWADAIYVTLARALGFGTNAEPFELLALTTPLKHTLRYSDSLQSIEAILFGQAGLLDEPRPGNEYHSLLCSEYRFLAAKYGLARSKNIAWKMSRMRPQNFPHRRIAALAALIYNNFELSRRILSVKSEAEARELFQIDLTGYWTNHYNFAEAGASAPKALSYASVTVLLINVVAPVLYAYGAETCDDAMQHMAVELLQGLKPERNSIVDIFQQGGIAARDAFDTQAMIQLRREYCLQRKCIYCRFGHKILSSKAKA